MFRQLGKKGLLGLFLAIVITPQQGMAATKYHRVAWDSDPSSNAVIGFSPDGTSTLPQVEYGYSTVEASWSTHTTLLQRTFDGLTSYFARLSGLPANSPVYYRVCDQDGCGDRFWFKTAPTDNTPFVVVAGGDTRTGVATRQAGNVLISKMRPLFIMHGGDYTNGNSGSEMGALLDDWALTYSSDSIDGFAYKRIYPIVPTHGNHENGNYSTLCQVFGIDYRDYGTCDEYDTYGAFNVSPLLRIYTLNSEFRDWATAHFGDMNSWLSTDMASNGVSVEWRFAQYHKPLFPHYTGKSENPDLYAAWSDDFYDDAMNLSVESDTHMMKTTKSVQPVTGTDPNDGGDDDFVSHDDTAGGGSSQGGTVFVGEGSWGAPARSADDGKSWSIDLASIQQFKVITVRPDRLEVRTAQFDDTATTLTHAERAADPVVLPRHVNWFDTNGIGEVLDLKRSAQERSVIDDAALFSGDCSFALCDFLDDSSVSGTTIVSWSWDFGDGNSSSVQHPLHGYESSGKYNVMLTVIDGNGKAHVFGKSVNAKTLDDTTIDVQISNGVDDAEERLSDGDMSLGSTDIELISDHGSSPDRGDQLVGLRFNDVNVPQGEIITSSYIRFTADEDDTRATNLVFRAEAQDNAPAFTSTTHNLSDRTMTSASVGWNNVVAWTTGVSYSSPDLSTVVQEVVDRGGWGANNSMVFSVTGTADSQRVAESYSGDAPAPILHLEYDGNVIEIPIASEPDDVEERVSDGDMSLASSDLELISEHGTSPDRGDQQIGLRFNNITVGQGVNVTSASIRFTADESDTRATNLVIRAQAHDNAPEFSGVDYNLTDRTMTSALVAWNNVANWTTGETYTSPDLSGVVQEVIDRGSWSTGNSMVFSITGTPDGARVAESYNGDTAAAPILHIEYDAPELPCTANRAIVADRWESFALPCDPGSSNLVKDVFYDLVITNGAVYNTDYFIYWYDPAANNYYKLTDENEVMYPGVGYWIYTLIPTTMAYTGTVNMTGDLSLVTDANDGVLNYIGYTEATDKKWGALKAANGATLVTIPNADPINGSQTECVLTPSDLCLVSSTAHIWNGTGWDELNPHVPGLNNDVKAGYGVFVRAFKPDTMLRISEVPASSPEASPATLTTTPGSTTMGVESLASASVGKSFTAAKKAKKVKSQPWFIRLIAESGEMRDHSNVLGQHPVSLDGLDLFDVEELSPFGSKYLSLTFINPEFPDEGWGYTSDYRAMTRKPKGEWSFLVRASSEAEEITLRWEGEKALLRAAILLDEQTGKKVRVRPGRSYTFVNSGDENYFTLIIR